MTNEARAGRGSSGVRWFGIVGLVFSIVLAIAILLGRGWLAAQVDGFFDSVDQGVGRASTVVAVATGRFDERLADLDTLVADAQAQVGAVTLPPALTQRVSDLADRFAQIRDGWVAIRARIDGVLETLAQLDRALPFIDLPTGPTDELAALDQRIAEIDASLTSLRTGATRRVQDVVDAATTLRGAVGRVSEVGVRLDTGLDAIGDRIDRARATIGTLMWLTTAGLLLLVGYVALLNVLIIRRPRGSRPADSAGSSNAPNSPDSPVVDEP
jgi:hypothetical protein